MQILLLFLKLCNIVCRFSKNMLFKFFRVPVLNSSNYAWFVTIKSFNPSRLEFIICIVISNIKIFSWFKLNAFLNMETTTTLN